jgi:hypothetical protein
MESNSSLLFEMRMLNELRKLKPEQRKEILDTLEREEKLEEEALKKNPNLHLENKLAQVLGELKDLRAEMQIIKNTCGSCPSISINKGNLNDIRGCMMDVCLRPQLQDDESIDCGECSFFSSSIDWWPIIIFVFIFLTIFSLPITKAPRPCPITLSA